MDADVRAQAEEAEAKRQRIIRGRQRNMLIEEARKFLREAGEYDDDYRRDLLADFALKMLGDQQSEPDTVNSKTGVTLWKQTPQV